MYKKSNIFFLVMLCSKLLFSKDTTLILLLNIESNDIQRYTFNNYSFNCSQYGIISIDEVYTETKNENCRRSIEEFYIKRPDLKYFAYKKLKVMQFYNTKFFKDGRCSISVSGEKTLSEFLLEEGLAKIRKDFKDRELQSYFYKAQYKAKYYKKGIWDKNNLKECSGEIFSQ